MGMLQYEGCCCKGQLLLLKISVLFLQYVIPNSRRIGILSPVFSVYFQFEFKGSIGAVRKIWIDKDISSLAQWNEFGLLRLKLAVAAASPAPPPKKSCLCTSFILSTQPQNLLFINIQKTSPVWHCGTHKYS